MNGRTIRSTSRLQAILNSLGGPMMRQTHDPSRDLLFGLIALQVGLIDQAKLVAAFQAWTLDK
jgi:hypothetical protein